MFTKNNLIPLLLFLTVFSSCMVFRDHPKTVPPDENAPRSYELVLKIRNEDAWLDQMRSISLQYELPPWEASCISDRHMIINMVFYQVPAKAMNAILKQLYDTRKVSIVELKPLN